MYAVPTKAILFVGTRYIASGILILIFKQVLIALTVKLGRDTARRDHKHKNTALKHRSVRGYF